MEDIECKVSFVGDIFPGDMPHHIGIGVASHFENHNGVPWENSIRKIFDGADHIIGNLESPITKNLKSQQTKDFIGTEKFAKFLRSVGITHLSVANNHILEKGENGFFETIDLLKENDIEILGINDCGGEKITYISKNKIKIALANFNSIHDIFNPGLYCELTMKNISDTIERMEENCFKVILLHWGHEYISLPSYDQIELAKKIIDRGVDVVIGHHPHVIQPVMNYRNGVIFFSLGNFIFDMTYTNAVRIGKVARFIFRDDGTFNYSYQPFFIDKDFCPIMKKENEKYLNSYVNKINNEFNSLLTLPNDLYTKYYLKKLRKNRILHRLIMKIDLLFSLVKMNQHGRKAFIDYLKRKSIAKKK